MRRQDFYLLQVNDALFPIGGYSHSQGLETYIQKGLVKDEKSAEEYIRNRLRWSLLHTDLLAVRLAYEYAGNQDIDGLFNLEETLEASRVPAEQREAARKMGSRFGKTVEKLELPQLQTGIFRSFLEKRKGMAISHCCVYGVFCACLETGEEACLAHYLYAQASAIVTNCVKTVPLSQSAGQKLLGSLYQEFEEILSEVKHCTEGDLCLSAPGFDLRGIQHERLYSRLYMS